MADDRADIERAMGVTDGETAPHEPVLDVTPRNRTNAKPEAKANAQGRRSDFPEQERTDQPEARPLSEEEEEHAQRRAKAPKAGDTVWYQQEPGLFYEAEVMSLHNRPEYHGSAQAHLEPGHVHLRFELPDGRMAHRTNVPEGDQDGGFVRSKPRAHKRTEHEDALPEHGREENGVEVSSRPFVRPEAPEVENGRV
jgi:hypothetical protein